MTPELVDIGLTDAQAVEAMQRAYRCMTKDETESKIGQEAAARQDADDALIAAVAQLNTTLLNYAKRQELNAEIAERTAGFAAHEAAFTAVTAAGAKNLLENTNAAGTIAIRNLQFTVNGDGSVDVAAGTSTGGNADLHINANAESGLTVGDTYILTGCPDGGSSTGYRVNISGKGADIGNGFAFTYDGGQIDVYIRISSGYTVTDSLHFEPMIRRAEITDGTFRPYAPTNRRLYEMLLALQSGASVSVQAGRTNIPEVTGVA